MSSSSMITLGILAAALYFAFAYLHSMFLVLVIGLVLLFSLYGSGSSSATPASTSQAPQQPTVIGGSAGGPLLYKKQKIEFRPEWHGDVDGEEKIGEAFSAWATLPINILRKIF